MTCKVGMVSLGCPKNQMDAELMLAKLEQAGFELVAESGLADVVIVNTCGFIEDAKKESIENILEFAQLKQEGRIQRIIVTGCLAERYQEELVTELPECDGVLGLGANGDIVEAVAPGDGRRRKPSGSPPRTAGAWKATGCRRPPAFSLICASGTAVTTAAPTARSRPSGAGCAPARWRALLRGGRKAGGRRGEGADPGGPRHHPVRHRISYGRGPATPAAARLVRHRGDPLDPAVVLLSGAHHRRVAGRHGRGAQGVAYLDVPLQHCSGRVLRAMNRPGDRGRAAALIRPDPGGAPGSGSAHHHSRRLSGRERRNLRSCALLSRNSASSGSAVLPFPREEGTPAASLPGQIAETVKAAPPGYRHGGADADFRRV